MILFSIFISQTRKQRTKRWCGPSRPCDHLEAMTGLSVQPSFHWQKQKKNLLRQSNVRATICKAFSVGRALGWLFTSVISLNLYDISWESSVSTPAGWTPTQVWYHPPQVIVRPHKLRAESFTRLLQCQRPARGPQATLTSNQLAIDSGVLSYDHLRFDNSLKWLIEFRAVLHFYLKFYYKGYT